MVRTNNEKDSYRWYVLSFGQTLLLKAAEQREETNPNLLLLETPQQAAANQRGVLDIDAVVESIELAKFDAKTIGDTILSLSSVENAPAIAGAFSYELVKRLLVKTPRLSRQEASTKRSTESRPVLQLQMQTVISADRLVLEGYISNYGKAPAVNVRIQFGFDRIPVASFLTLQVGEKRELSLKATMPIKSGMRVVVHFDRGDEHFRQDGLFEEALGSPATLLMKGLGDLQELSTARY